MRRGIEMQTGIDELAPVVAKLGFRIGFHYGPAWSAT
jgi:hypothetical protein